MVNDFNISMDENSIGIECHDTPIDFENTRIVPSLDVHCTVLEEEAVLLELKTGHYYTLNRVGTVAWKLLTTGKSTLKDVHRAICSRFDVSETQAMNDLIFLVNQLFQEGLIQQERR